MWALWGGVALGWGPEAHEAIAERAEAALSPQARAALREITDVPLSELSTLLDRRKREAAWQWSRPLHFVNIDPQSAGFLPERDCPDYQCATAALAHFTHRLTDRIEPEEALAVVVHLVGDIHQPLHVSYAHDRGGNDHRVWIDGAPGDLHTLWDDVLPTRPGALDAVPVSGGGSPTEWAAESLALTRSLAYAVPADTAVSAAYLDVVTPVVAQRTSQASVRLAALLESALTGVAPAMADPLAGTTYDRSAAGLAAPVRNGAVMLGLLLVGLVGAGVRWRWSQRSGATPGYRALRDLLGMPGLFLGALAAVAMTISVEILTPLAFQYGLDVILPAPTTGLLTGLAAVFLLSMVLSVVGWYLAAASLSRLSARFQDTLRQRMLASLQGASLRRLHRYSAADLLTRFGSDLQQFDLFLLRELPRLFRSAIQAAALLVVMVSIDPWLTTVTLVMMPLVAWLPRRLAGRSRRARDVRQEAEATAGTIVQELVEAQPMLRAFGLERRWQARFSERAEVLRAAVQRQGWFAILIPGIGFIAGQAMLTLVLAVATMLAVRGDLTVGGFSAMFSALVLMAGAVSRLTAALPGTASAISAYGRICAVTDLPRTEGTAPGQAVPPLVDAVSIEAVSFSHTGAERHLDGLSLQVRAGQTTAIVGPSGAGKSTLLWLLMRHAMPESGRILWDGTPLHTDHRAAIGLVPQHSPIFAMSIRENIRLGDLTASDEAVEEAARKAAIHDVIAAMPGGYDAAIGPGNAGLSGGQKQRIAIARALLRAPSLLVLDEATSALDPATAARVRQTLDDVRRSCTTLVITHDLASVQDYDHIVVLDAGRVADQGTHAGLMARCGLYRSLVEQQSGFVVAASGRQATVTPERLAKLPLFSAVPGDLRARLAEKMTTEVWQDGEVVVRHGEVGDRMFLIARGRLLVSLPGKGSVGACDAGSHVGEIALLFARPRTATLTASGFCLLLSISRADLAVILKDAPAVRQAMLDTARQRLEADGEGSGTKSATGESG